MTTGHVGTPLIVDLDHTLLLTDSLDEQAAALLLNRPLAFLSCAARLRHGLPAFKAALAAAAPAAPDWPRNEALVEYLRQQAAAGRELHLVSAAHDAVVKAVAAETGLFRTATGTTGRNLKGPAKAALLRERFPGGFAYAGDSRADLAVWSAAAGAVLVGVAPSTRDAVARMGVPVERDFPAPAATAADWANAIRVHHWAKNVFVFVPLVLAHGWGNAAAVLATLMGFLLLLIVTSATYLINDLADLPADRQHWSKRRRPIAAGRIPIRVAAGAAACGLAGGLGASLLLSPAFTLALCGYVALTLGYSMGLKRVPLLDTLVIAILFTSRILMGITLSAHPVSDWLLFFSLALFFCLATAKRHTELLRAREIGGGARLNGRGYVLGDSDLTLVLGVASGLLSVLILALYIVLDAFSSVGYGAPGWLRLIPLLLAIWIGRIWLLAHRGEMEDDPVSFALRDRASLALGAAVVSAFVLAL